MWLPPVWYTKPMDRVRAIAVVLGLVAPATGMAAPGDLSDPVMIFAACAGRLSAELEHQWLDGRSTPGLRQQRAAMIDLVDAVRPADSGKHVLARRIEAKFAQASLLQRATFSRDAAEASRARDLARAARDSCLTLLP